jgi:hypothetical protein
LQCRNRQQSVKISVGNLPNQLPSTAALLPQILTETLSHSAMLLFGWRIAFLLGAFTGVVGVMLRRRMPDPTVFLQRKHAIEEQLGVTDSQAPDDRCACALRQGCH